jgi:predicted TIM-barrel fold metal-dependent hydrolase
MTYVGDRLVYDADSHVMELADFLDPYVDEEVRPLLHTKGVELLKPRLDKAHARFVARREDAAQAAEAEGRLLQDKGWDAMGAFDTEERSRVLDLMGISGQLVFGTFASSLWAGKNLDRLYGGAAAQNRAMNAFCAGDPRLLAVAYVPLRDPERAVALAREAIDGGAAAVMVPHTAAGDRSPSHPDLDPFWQVLADADVPFVLHVGGGSRLIDPAFHNNAMPVSDHLGGGENVRSKDYLAIPHEAQTFLGVLILDGVFDRFPALRGGVIELGAGWAVSWLHHLDFAVTSFGRTEEPLRRLQRKPSEYVREHLTFTPFPGEDVGWMIRAAGPELFMFSSDYPHPEGTRDPLGKFEAKLEGISDEDRAAFYAGNFARLLGSRTPAPLATA